MRKRFIASAGVAGLLIGAGLCGPAAAEEQPLDGSAVSAVDTIAPEVLAAAATTTSDADTAAG